VAKARNTLKYTFCLGELDSPIFWRFLGTFPFLVVPPRHCLRQRLQQLIGQALSGQHGSSFHQAGGRNHIGRQPILGCTLCGCQIQNGPIRSIRSIRRNMLVNWVHHITSGWKIWRLDLKRPNSYLLPSGKLT
jgi:hypothetical protein